LASKFPLHVVTSWIGNSEIIAKRNYLSVTDADFAAAPVIPSAAERLQPRLQSQSFSAVSVGKIPDGDVWDEREKHQENKENAGRNDPDMSRREEGEERAVPPRGVEPLF
jgi:hypothetical protein